MTLTHVPYQHKDTKQLVLPYSVTEQTVYYRLFNGGGEEYMVSASDFSENFERVYEAPPAKGWDEEL